MLVMSFNETCKCVTILESDRVRPPSAHMRYRYQTLHMRDPFILVTPLESALPQNVISADALEGRADSICYYSHGEELHAIPKPGWIMGTHRYQCSVLTSALSVQVFPVNKPERRSHAGDPKEDDEEHEERTLNGNAGCARGEDSRGQDEEVVQGDKTQTSMAVPSRKVSSHCALRECLSTWLAE